MYKKLSLLFLGLLLLNGCTSRESGNDAVLPLILIDSFEVWHNLMPGGAPSLYFTAVVKLEKKAEAVTDSIYIDKVSLFKGDSETAYFKTSISDITGEYPDSVSGKWYLYRLVPEQGYADFKADTYENYTAHITLSGKFGSLTVKKTGIDIQKVY